MTSADDEDEKERLMEVTVGEGDVLTLELEDAEAFSERCPEQYADLIEMSAFVNWRRVDVGLRPIVALSFYK